MSESILSDPSGNGQGTSLSDHPAARPKIGQPQRIA